MSGPAEIINMQSRDNPCWVCGGDSFNTGIPIYEDWILPNDWGGDWCGQPACQACFDLQGKLTKPMRLAAFKRLRGTDH